MITYATTYFKPFFFEAALSVNLTTMLVMTTIFISKMEGLPPTSATKMIDYWLILCQLVPFIQVVLVTALEFLRDDVLVHNHMKVLKRIKKTFKLGVLLKKKIRCSNISRKTYKCCVPPLSMSITFIVLLF